MDLLRKTIQLDIYWINYLWGAKADWWLQLLGGPFRHGIGIELVKHVAKIFRSFWYRLRFRPVQHPKRCKFLFFADSINQWRSLFPVKQKLEDACFCVDGKFEGEIFFPADYARILSFLFVPVLMWRTFGRNAKIQPWTLGYGLSFYLDCYGYFWVAVRLFKKWGPSAVVLSNDHAPQTRAIREAAEYMGIKTIYLQHAPVTSDFPPLEFDLALLDGEIAKNHYSVHPSQCEVRLVGMSRRPETTINSERSLYSVGIAFNDFDLPETIEAICLDLLTSIPSVNVTIRPHPADWRRFEQFKELARVHGLKYSDPSQESAWKFLTRIGVLIGGNSGILLDAAFSGIIPVQHESMIRGYDHYGYQELKIVTKVRTAREIAALEDHQERLLKQIRESLNRFDVTFGTSQDGKAPELAAKEIKNYLLT